MSTEQWLSAKQIAAEKSVSYNTARRWIIQIMGHHQPRKAKGRGKRPYSLRRVPRSLLEKNLYDLLNG